MISIRLVEFSGSGSPRRKRRGMPDGYLLRDSCTAFTRLRRRKASVKVMTYPTIVEIQSAVSAVDKDRIIGTLAGGRRAIASKAVHDSSCNAPAVVRTSVWSFEGLEFGRKRLGCQN